MSENTENQTTEQAIVEANQKAETIAEHNARLQKIAVIGVKTAQAFMAVDLKIGQTKREALIKASKQFDVTNKEELDTFLSGYAGEYIAKRQSEGTAATRKSEAKIVLLTIALKGVEAVEKMGGEWNDFMNQCREIAGRKPVENKVNNNAQDGKGAEAKKIVRNIGQSQVDNMAEKAEVLSTTQNYQVIQANIAAMAEKPGFEVALMQAAHSALLEILERTQDEFWKKNAESMLAEAAEILAAAKRAATDAVEAAHAAKENSKVAAAEPAMM
jgi:hypothetical protein